MSYQVFARKYRPRTFKDVLGQDHVVRTLCNAIEQQRLAHAYLFVGPRGTGKTSTARIFAKALNCTDGPKVDFDPDEDVCLEIAEGRSLDVQEIDGASNRGIDNIRDLRDNVQFAPTRGKYRIIYIDEVHMLTKESFNALLKTLEEPPAHVMFIFATTEPHKILPTILSRCQRFDLRPIPADVIARHLVNIASNEGVTLDEDAAYAIATVADGGMRDAQSMLDQLVSFCGNHITEQNVNDIFGVTSRETVAKALAYMLDRQLPSLLHLVHELAEAGRDMGQLLSELMGAVRELLITKVAPQEAHSTLPEQWRASLSELLSRTPTDKIIRLMEVLSHAEEQMRWSTNKRLYLEMGLIQAVHSLAEANISDIIRALNGAPLPETPIATVPLPAVTMPGAATAPAPAQPTPVAPSPDSAPMPAPVPQPAPVQVTPEPVMPAGLEPIDDAPPLFGDMPPAESADDLAPAERALTPADWDAVLADVREKSPIASADIGHTLFISDDDGLATIAIHPEDRNSHEALLGEALSELISNAAQERCGHGLRLRIVTDASVPPPTAVEILPPPNFEELAPAPKPKPKAEAPTPVPKPAAETAAPASLKPSDEEFYHDPLIEQALEVFHATLIKP
ncbi:MAG: DNA polymerase III subunit gamma/tau [Akkermansia sp.]|nr:DNA polymerase III subunit gamma/tau [Akkermansia sp.]